MGFDKRGFTLVEMMIALVVLSLISIATLTALRTMGRTQDSLEATTARVDELRQVSQFLRNSLRQAIIPPQSGVGGTWAVPPPGLQLAQHDEVVWLAPFDAVGGAGGLNYFRLYRDDDTLRLQFQPRRVEFDPASWAAREAGEILVNELEEFHIDYRLLRDEPWVAQIAEDDMRSVLPQSLRIVVKAKGRYWPDIVISFEQGGGVR